MRNKGFTIIEMMVSLAVLSIVIALTVYVFTYQSSLGVYKIQATTAQQAVETALVVIRNDLLQAGGWALPTANNQEKKLFIKYNGFVNLEAPSAEGCTQLRSVFCPRCEYLQICGDDCLNCGCADCGEAWTKVDSSNSFTMDRFPKYLTGGTDWKSIFLGVLSLNKDCKTLEDATESSTVTSIDPLKPPGMQTLKFYISGTGFNVESYASPAIVYQCKENELLRNGTKILGTKILGGDILVKSLTLEEKIDENKYWSVSLTYMWKTRLIASKSGPIDEKTDYVEITQKIYVGIPSSYILRIEG
jgi:prepilin-type N-terminal cleavage/methylation domain-containing protein